MDRQRNTYIQDTSGQDQTLAAPSGWRRLARQPWAWAALLAVVALALGGWLARGWSQASHSVDVQRLRIASVQRGDLVRDLSADGRVITANSPTLYAIAAGTVSLHVVAGDAVQAGQALAVIDSPGLRSALVQEEATLARLQGEARRAGLQAEMADANAQKLLDQASIDQTAALRDLERAERAFAKGAVSRNDLDRARDGLQKAEIGLKAAGTDARLQGQSARIDAENTRLLAERQLAVVEELRRQVQALTLRAPFDGQVGQVQVAQGAHVSADAPVLGVVDLSVFEVEIRVPESFARDLAIGVPAQVRSSGNTFAAGVSAVSPEVVNGEVTARLRFAEGEQPPGLRQNQRLSARVVLDTREDVLWLERGPFIEQERGHAYVVVDGIAVRRPVRLGASSLGAVEILDGLAEGERVVVSGSDLFRSAERVRIGG